MTPEEKQAIFKEVAAGDTINAVAAKWGISIIEVIDIHIAKEIEKCNNWAKSIVPRKPHPGKSK